LVSDIPAGDGKNDIPFLPSTIRPPKKLGIRLIEELSGLKFYLHLKNLKEKLYNYKTGSDKCPKRQ
jgi:hypothetical protein